MKLNNLILLSVGAFLLSSASTFAQQTQSQLGSVFSMENESSHQNLWFTFSPSLSSVTNENTYTYNDYQTFSLGYTISRPLKDSSLPLLVESGIYASLLNYTKSNKHTGNLVSLKVPANLLLHIGLSPDFVIYPYAGLYGKLNVFGRETYQTTTSDGTVKKTLNILDKGDMGNNAIKYFLIGYQGGVRLRFSRYYASFEYESSFTNWTSSAKYHLTSFGIGIMF